MHWEKKKDRERLFLFLCASFASVPVCFVSLGAQKCVHKSDLVYTSENMTVWLFTISCVSSTLWTWRCVCVLSCVSMHIEEMDIYISSWLNFPGLSLMALCSGAELLFPTYFMTSCAPHATLLLLDNTTSPLSTVWRVATLTLSAFLFVWLVNVCFSYFICSAFLHFAEYVGQNKMTKPPLLCYHKNNVWEMFSNCACEQIWHNSIVCLMWVCSALTFHEHISSSLKT